MKKFRKIVVASVAALAAVPAGAEDLHEVLGIVYATNPTIRAERNRQEATTELHDQALAGVLPRINANASVGRSRSTQTTTAGLFAGNQLSTRRFKLESNTVSVDGEQTLFSGFRNYHALRQAKSRITGGQAQLHAIEQQVLLDAATAYFDVARDLEVYNANVSNVAVLLKQSDDSEVQFELGNITRTDVMQAAARLAGSRAQLSSAKTQLSISRSQFKEFVGAAPGTLVADPPLPELPETLEEALAFAAVNAPSVLVVRSDEEASRREILIAKGARLPTVSMTASYLRADEPSSFVVEDEQWSYGLRLTVPIFQGGLEFSRVREAKALHARDRSRVIAADRNIEAQVTSVWEQLFEARARIESAKAQAEANKSALTGVRREAQLGSRTTLDVLNAEQEYLNSTVSLASAHRDEQVAAYALLATIGAMSVESADITATAAADPDITGLDDRGMAEVDLENTVPDVVLLEPL